MLLLSARIERSAFASANLAADSLKLNPTGYLTADKDGDDDDDCNKTHKPHYSLSNNKNDELTAITGTMTPTSVKVTF
ncbi:hypothetical protein [Allocoleopsis sp.]|uniref:hypothetical protein n=1 Tax=Allocoleopsis sp. TaxID=3088169 RepID=UPI002FCE9BC7